MRNHRLFVPAIAAIVLSAPLGAQATPVASANFSTAAVAEVRNAQGQVVLTGRFVANDEDDDDIERKAVLAPTTIHPNAAGEAEIEIDRTGNPRKQEVEFEVRNLPASTTFTLVVDGKVVGTVTTNSRGRASMDRDIPLSGGN